MLMTPPPRRFRSESFVPRRNKEKPCRNRREIGSLSNRKSSEESESRWAEGADVARDRYGKRRD